MPGVAREKPAENTRSRTDPIGMALKTSGKLGKTLPDVDHGGGPSLGRPVASLLPEQREIPHGAWRGQRGKTNRVERVTSRLEDRCSEHIGPLFLLHHERVELRQDDRTKVKDG